LVLESRNILPEPTGLGFRVGFDSIRAKQLLIKPQ